MKNLKKNKNYYFRIRIVSKENGKTVKSAWSAGSSIKLKK